MTKIRNIAFSILIILFLLGPAALWVVQGKLHLSLPSQITAESANYLLGNANTTNVRQNLTVDGFVNEQLQASLEKAINNHIPSRANAFLINAHMQKLAIEASNMSFGWDCYPTFYGSQVLYDQKYHSLLSTPFSSSNVTADALSGIEAFGEELALFAEAHSEVEICIVVPELREKSQICPAWNLVSQKWSLADCITIWNEQIISDGNVHICYNNYEDYSNYLENYYRYDSHWNGLGAIHAYNQAAKEIHLPLFSKVPGKNESLSDYLFYGNLCRQGRILLDGKGQLTEPLFNTEAFTVNDGIANAQVLNAYSLTPEESMYAAFNFYSWYYGDDLSSTIINERIENDEAVLIVCDSFGDAFRWAAASNCRETHSIYDLHRSSKNEASLSSRIENSHATKVVFVGSIANYSTFIDRHPNYFLHD